MKRYLIGFCSALLVVLTACDTWIDPKLNVNPNTPETAAYTVVLPTIQAGMAYVMGGDFGRYTSVLNQQNTGVDRQHLGIYNYQFSAQLRNSGTQIHSAWIWLRKNNVDIGGTGSKFDVPNSHGGIDGHTIAACNFYVQLEAGDTIEMWAAVDNVAVTFDAAAAQTTPFAMPSIPSVVATLTFVSES